MLTSSRPHFPCQTLCFRVRKMIDVYKPDWCEVRENWSVYLFSPENRWGDQAWGEVRLGGGEWVWEGESTTEPGRAIEGGAPVPQRAPLPLC